MQILCMLSRVEQEFPIAVLRSEARLLALIKDDPGHAVKYYMTKSEMSYRSFFNCLGTLTSCGLVMERLSEIDRRQRILS